MIPALAFAAVAALANSQFAENLIMGPAPEEAQVSLADEATTAVNSRSGRLLAMEALNAAPNKALAA